MSETEYQPEVTMYLRSLPSTGVSQQQREFIDRLQAMERAGDIAGFEVKIWGEKIPRNPQTSIGRSMLDQIETFENWSDRANTSLAPFFETRAFGSLLTNDITECIVPPVCCLVEHDGDTIHHVTPCINAGAVQTVADRLDAIEGGAGKINQSRVANV